MEKKPGFLSYRETIFVVEEATPTIVDYSKEWQHISIYSPLL